MTGARTPDSEAYPKSLEAAEAVLVIERRQQADPASAAAAADEAWPSHAVGFGLSGGGIRSATFALGVFQALAKASLVRKIDFLSTVSGGGYFGAFLGRLFTRDWITSAQQAERVIQGLDATPQMPPSRQGWGRRVFRWLRDNGRYLAPRGSGDLMVLVAILIRNLLAVQVVLVTTVLTLFVGLQIVRAWGQHWVASTSLGAAVATILCKLPGGATKLWWSPWILTTALPLLLVAAPAGWAYWLVVTKTDGRRGVPPVFGLLAACLVGFLGSLSYDPISHPLRLAVSLIVFLVGVLAVIYWIVGQSRVRRRADLAVRESAGLESKVETRAIDAQQLRNWLSAVLKTGLVAAGLVLVWSLVDTVGGTIYALAYSRTLGHWAAGLLSVFAGIGAFSRQIGLLLSSDKSGPRTRIPMSIVAWAGALVVGGLWLVAINIGSQAIALNFTTPDGVPPGLTAPAPTLILGADHLVVGRCAPGLSGGEAAPCEDAYVVRAVRGAEATCEASIAWPAPSGFAYAAFLVLALFTWLFGNTRTFANLSTIHTFYAERLTRTYLGASSESRLREDAPVTETKPDDDYASESYWKWPQFHARSADVAVPGSGAYAKGGPLHLINTTINETYDERTRLQNQDRKGTNLAIGPCGLSVGIRHHLISNKVPPEISPPSTAGHRVFSDTAKTRTPDPLSLGKWTSISGAAFSAAAGANTTVPIALLCGLFNVRLGYWWDSGTPASSRSRLERALPVQAALFAEMLARTRGTAGRLWNLSDGGHFENMGGYELIRRRLPVNVIIDAEADPDYTFEWLSDLVRKARLDFGAEVTFLSGHQLAGEDEITPGRKLDPAVFKDYFGDLDALRRGKWTDDNVPFPPDDKQYAIEVDRSRVSRAHAALARVEYLDNEDATWLVYVKATLMGDEPEDVRHYHRAHPAFPQEPTADQFFDERQWESYRRLGQHIGHRVLTEALFDHLRSNPA